MVLHDWSLSTNVLIADYNTDIQTGIQAAASNSSGTSDPVNPLPCQFSARTDTLALRMRNTANNAWITVGTLDQPNLGLATDANLTLHTGASAQVHGLPASTRVLGNRNAAGEFIQHGSAASGAITGTSASVASYRDIAVTFPVAFSSAPKVFVNSSNNSAFPNAISVTASGFTARVYDTNSAAGSLIRSIDYIAIGS